MLVRTLLPADGEALATVGEDAPLVTVARLLSGSDSNLVVVQDATGSMKGVITKTDVVARISRCAGAACTAPAASAMTREVIACRPDDALRAVWGLMMARGLKRVPVVDAAGRALGVLSARQILQALLEEVEYEEELLKDYVMCVGYR